MAKKSDKVSEGAPKKRRWYQNYIDAYNVITRSFSWFPIVLIAAPIIVMGLAVLFAILTGGWVFWMIAGVLTAALVDLGLLAYLLRPAMYRQVDGKAGAVYAVLSQITRGWVIDDEPVAVNRSQDVIWQIIGRPGVVLISEGPSSRVLPMLNNERKRINRAITNVPIIYIQTGNDEGQVPIPKLMRKLKKQKKVLTKHEVPAVANRLSAIGSRGVPVPKGVDPYKARQGSSRRALRGQ